MSTTPFSPKYERPKWKMPQWMKKFVPCIVNTGGNDVTDMMNGNATPDINLPLSTLQACVKSQVALLYQLKKAGRIK